MLFGPGLSSGWGRGAGSGSRLGWDLLFAGWVAHHYFGWFKYMAILSFCSVKNTFLTLARVVSLKITRKLMRREWIGFGRVGGGEETTPCKSTL